MPALVKTEFVGKIVWLGRVTDRDASLKSEPVQQLTARFSGVEGEDHGQLTRPSCARVATLYLKGTEIKNTRQLSILSAEELAEIAQTLGVDHFDPAWCGAGMVIEGIPDFTHIPPSSRLQSENGVTLTVDMENLPCHLPAPVIDQYVPDAGRQFKLAAKNRRGVTAWVEREGVFRIGDAVSLYIPRQRVWHHLPD